MGSISQGKHRGTSKLYSMAVALIAVVAFAWLAAKLKNSELPKETPETRAAAKEEMHGMGQSAGY